MVSEASNKAVKVPSHSGELDVTKFLWVQTRRHLGLLIASPGEIVNPLFVFLARRYSLSSRIGPRSRTAGGPGARYPLGCGLLANLMICMRLFVDDFEDGSLEQLAMAPLPLAVAVVPQLVASWLASGVILSLVSPLFGLMLGFPLQAAPTLIASLLMGTLIMLLLGGVGAALTVGIQRGGILLALLILPLYVPILIAGTRALEEATSQGDPMVALALLGAGVTGGLVLAPLAIAAGLRVSLEL